MQDSQKPGQWRCCLVLAVVVGGGFTAWFWSAAGSGAGLVVGGVTLVAVAVSVIMAARISYAASSWDVQESLPPGPVRLGETFRAGVVVTPRRPLVMGPAKATLCCTEHAISRDRSGDTHYRHTVYENDLEVAEQRRVSVGEVLEVNPELTIPVEGMPSLAAKDNSINWEVVVSIPVAGWCPDLNRRVQVNVANQMAPGAERESPDSALVPASSGSLEQGPLRAEFWGYQGPLLDGVPTVVAGDRLRATVLARSAQAIRCRGVRCWAGCRIHGSGDTDTVVLINDEFIHEGDLAAGQTVLHRLDIAIPASGPVSYAGRYIKCDWCVRLRVDIPVWRDRRLDLPFIVTPPVDQERA